jgi:hypothetical protein
MQIFEPNRQVAIVCFLPASSCTQLHADGLNKRCPHASLVTSSVYCLIRKTENTRHPKSETTALIRGRREIHLPATRSPKPAHLGPRDATTWRKIHPSTRAVATVDTRGVAVPGRGRPESWRAAYREGKEEDGAAWLYIAAARQVFP